MRMIPTAHGILAHYFHGDDRLPAQGSLSEADWRAGLDAYGTRLVPAREWIDRLLSGRQKDEVCASFDDGLSESLLALPELHKRGLTANFNIYTGPYLGVANELERYRWIRNFAFGDVKAFYVMAQAVAGYGEAPADYLTDRDYLTDSDRAFRHWRNHARSTEYEEVMDKLWAVSEDRERFAWPWLSEDNIRTLDGLGHVIGLHTHSHPTEMSCLSKEQQALEYATSRLIVGNILNRPVREITVGAHPCGSYTDYGLTWLRDNGLRVMWAATKDGDSPLTAPRVSTGSWR